MRVTLSIDPTNYQADTLRQDVQTFLHCHARKECNVSEEMDFDGLTLLTVKFRDPLDAADFKLWRNIRHHICRS
jgi:hypothetical protein